MQGDKNTRKRRKQGEKKYCEEKEEARRQKSFAKSGS